MGNGGGAIISSSFRYAKGWGGHVLIGSNVEMTRGAEVGGLSLVGWEMDNLQRLGYSQKELINIFTEGKTTILLDCLEKISQSSDLEKSGGEKVGLYGVVKLKRSCILGYARIRDDVRLHGSFIKNAEIRERCKIFFSAICSDSNILDLNVNDRAIEKQFIYDEVSWENYPTSLTNDDYLLVDYEFYKKVNSNI
jgi:hypothetical protein